MIPEADYYHSSEQPKQEQKQQNQNVYLPPPPQSRAYMHGMLEAEEGQDDYNYMVIDCMVKR